MIAFLKEHNTHCKNCKFLRKELINAKGSLQNLSLFLQNLCDGVIHCIKQGCVCVQAAITGSFLKYLEIGIDTFTQILLCLSPLYLT